MGTRGGSIRSVVFQLGEPEVGPTVQLGAVTSLPGVELDWEHGIDPMHFHGSDQFRLVLGGEWILAREPIHQSGFRFQESGRVYQERPGPSDHSWIMLIMGDRRGASATLTRKEDQENYVVAGDAYDAPLGADESYPHPAGPKGVAAVATSGGACERGYRSGSFADTASWRGLGDGGQALAGVWGDPTAGPALFAISGAPGRVAIPACTFATEVMLAVAGGSCRIGDAEYRAGDLRVQRADSAMDAVVSGPDGLSAALLVADRRAVPGVATSPDDGGSAWKRDLEELFGELRPTPVAG
jgi:hypothetical protein